MAEIKNSGFEERVKIMVKQRLLENIKNFGYVPPKDPEQLLYDFYFIVGYLQGDRVDDPVLDFVFKEATQICVTNLRKHMLEALRWSLAAEFRNLFGDYASIAIDELPKDLLEFFKLYLTKYTGYNDTTLQKLQPERLPSKKAKSLYFQDTSLGKTRDTFSSSRDESYAGSYFALEWTQKRLKLSDSELANILQQAFTSDAIEWSLSYGGESWGKIADAYRKLLEADTLAKQIAYIDHAYDLQHNTGSVFSKVKAYSKNRGSLSWLAKALDWKKNQTDLRGFYSRVSGTLRPVVAWVAKNEAKVGTLEDLAKSEEAQGFTPCPLSVSFEVGKWYFYTGPISMNWLKLHVSPDDFDRSTRALYIMAIEAAEVTSIDTSTTVPVVTFRAQGSGQKFTLLDSFALVNVSVPLIYSSPQFAAAPPDHEFSSTDPEGFAIGDKLTVSPAYEGPLPPILERGKVYTLKNLTFKEGGPKLYEFEGLKSTIEAYANVFQKAEAISAGIVPKPNTMPFKVGHWYKWIGPKVLVQPGKGLFVDEAKVYYNKFMTEILDGRPVRCTGPRHLGSQASPAAAKFEKLGFWHWYELSSMPNPEVPLFAEVPPPR